ncbi:MAG: hypothetical protein JNL57_04550 [Bacteroidetes bacterium]|nr:hypothetical protein [Bacteroidota bacterium]
MNSPNRYIVIRHISAVILSGFGLLTLFLSLSVILDLFHIREKEGNYVLFVVWANFLSSIIYLIAAFGFLFLKKWTRLLLTMDTLLLLLTLLAFLIYIQQGGIHETKTVGAMLFRISLTAIFAWIAHFIIHQKNELKK